MTAWHGGEKKATTIALDQEDDRLLSLAADLDATTIGEPKWQYLP